MGRGQRDLGDREAWVGWGGGVRASGREGVVPSAAFSSLGWGVPWPPSLVCSQRGLLWPADPTRLRQGAGLPIIPGLRNASSQGIRWSRCLCRCLCRWGVGHQAVWRGNGASRPHPHQRLLGRRVWLSRSRAHDSERCPRAQPPRSVPAHPAPCTVEPEAEAVGARGCDGCERPSGGCSGCGRGGLGRDLGRERR